MTVRPSRARCALALFLAMLALPALPSRARAQKGNGQLGDVVDAGVDFKTPLQPTFVAQLQDGERGERLAHRGDAKLRVPGHRRGVSHRLNAASSEMN